VTIYGWDASHYDAIPNVTKLIAEGFSFMTHKAGGDADDAELRAWWNAVKGQRSKLLLGAYWVLYPGSAAIRANKFLACLDSQCPGWRDGPFILQVDCEKWNGDASTVPDKADIKAFCDRLVALAPKLRPIVYAPKWVYENDLAGLGYPLWASDYVGGSGPASKLYPGDTSSRWAAYSGQTPAILQFSSSATIAGQTTCDANAYRGTLDQLTALLAPGWSDDMALTPTDGLTVWKTDTIPNPSFRADSKTNPTTTANFALGDVWDRVGDMQAAVTALTAKVDALAAKPVNVDQAALAASIVALLPADLAKQLADVLAQRLAQ
jgi:GH25 family lysozyme M1 (1,4-beta-N-acetylmuramidase)